MKAAVIALAVVMPMLGAAQQLQTPAPAPQFEAVPSAEQVRIMLQSDDPKSKAWGAWWTAQSQMRGMEPLLQKNLEQHYHGNTFLDQAVMDLTLDAYIQNSGNLPPVDLLKSVFPRRPAQSLILFSRLTPSPSVDLALLELLPTEEGRGTGVEWYAMADFLFAHRARGFAASLLQNIRISARVTVCDPGDCDKLPMSMPPMSVSIAGEGMLSSASVPGVPPWPIYTLQRVSENPAIPPRSNTILASGPVSIAYNRRVGPAGFSPSEVQSSHGWQLKPPIPTTADRFKYLSALLSFGDLVKEYEFRMFAWNGADNFIGEVARFREDIRQNNTTLVQLLRANGLLSEEEAANVRGPLIDISVGDVRAVKTSLPDVSPTR